MSLAPHITAHFAQHDPVMGELIKKVKLQPIKTRAQLSLFHELADNIVSQQLSNAAAATIFNRLLVLVENELTPPRLLALSDDQLRAVGLSWAKVRYVKNLAEHVTSGQLDLSTLSQLEDEAIITALTAVKGIGRWTAEMFLLFTLGREDVFSFGDLALKKSLASLYGVSEPLTPALIAPIIEKWRPYSSYASLALWKRLDLR